MIRSLLVPDFRLDSMIPVFGILVFTFLIQANMSDMLWKHHPYQPVVLAGVWGIGTYWGRLICNEKWKAVSNGEEILGRLLQRNTPHLFIPGDTPFTRDKLAYDL